MTIGVERQSSKKLFSVLGAVVLLAVMAASYVFIWKSCLAATAGHFTYALDDPYIHLAIARNFALHGVWGVTPFANSAASSSPLWILLLTVAIRIGGDWVFWPFVFGILFSVASTLFLYNRFLWRGIPALYSMVAAFAVFAIGPAHVLPFTGMEHSLQILIDLIFAFWLLDALDRTLERKDFGIAVLLTALICSCRYESVFLLVVPFAVCVWRRNWMLAAALVIGPTISIGGFSLFSKLMGMPLLPNSIVLKGTVPDTFSPAWFQALYLHLRGRSIPLADLFLLNVTLGLSLRARAIRYQTTALQVLLWTLVVACLLHAGLAAIGFFYRYEAYLVTLLATVIVLVIHEFMTFSWKTANEPVTNSKWWLVVVVAIGTQFLLSTIFWFYQLSLNLIVTVYAIGFVALVSSQLGPKTQGRLVKTLLGCILPLALYFSVRDRAMQALNEVPRASDDVYAQQFQMSRFIERYYPTGHVAANDIGAISYFTQVHLLDLWGLASDNVRMLKVKKIWNAQTIKQEIGTFKPDLVVAYPQWFVGERALPSSLIPVGTWTIPAVTSAARRVVMFYAPTNAAAIILRKHLKEFQPSLPSNVTALYGQDAVNHVPRI